MPENIKHEHKPNIFPRDETKIPRKNSIIPIKPFFIYSVKLNSKLPIAMRWGTVNSLASRGWVFLRAESTCFFLVKNLKEHHEPFCDCEPTETPIKEKKHTQTPSFA